MRWNPFEFPLSQLLDKYWEYAITDLLPWKDPGHWFHYTADIALQLVLIPLACGVIAQVVRKQTHARFAVWVIKLAWNIFICGVAFFLMIWALGYWPLSIPGAITAGYLYLKDGGGGGGHH